jgi:hypothetical protein
MSKGHTMEDRRIGLGSAVGASLGLLGGVMVTGIHWAPLIGVTAGLLVGRIVDIVRTLRSHRFIFTAGRFPV